MKIFSRTVVCAAIALFGVAPAAAEEDVRGEMAEMKQMVEQLKGQVEAQSEQLSHQGEMLRDYKSLENERAGESKLAEFFESLEFEGWVAASYFWNFNDPGSKALAGGNAGLSGAFYPFHPDHDSFSVDQVWFGLEKPISEDSRAGFRFDIVYGKTACFLGASAGTSCPGDDASQMYVNQAYVQYLAPIGNGVTVKAGRFGTLIGMEVAQTTANWNITRGNVYNLLQPIDHEGVLASTDLAGGFGASLGVVNGFASADPDINDGKSVLGQINWSGETAYVGFTAMYGAETIGRSDKQRGTLDLVASWDATEDLSMWLNADLAWAQANGTKATAWGWGVAAAARYALTEKLGAAIRAEYVGDDNNFFGFTSPSGTAVDSSGVVSLTGTVDYALADQLLLRSEVRWDTIWKKHSGNGEFIDNPTHVTPNQVTAGVEVVYTF